MIWIITERWFMMLDSLLFIIFLFHNQTIGKFLLFLFPWTLRALFLRAWTLSIICWMVVRFRIKFISLSFWKWIRIIFIETVLFVFWLFSLGLVTFYHFTWIFWWTRYTDTLVGKILTEFLTSFNFLMVHFVSISVSIE